MTDNKHKFDPQLLDAMLANYQQPDDLLGSGGILEQLTKALLERALAGELNHHLGYAKHDSAGHHSGNSRNGTTPKTVKSKRGEMRLEVPRDRNGEFEPQLIPKHQRRFDGFDEQIIALYTRGMTVRDIKAHLQEMYQAEVSPELISHVTEAVLQEAQAWQTRPLEESYPIVWFDGLVVKIRHEGRVEKRAVYLALALRWDGQKEVLGLWFGGAGGREILALGGHGATKSGCPRPSHRLCGRSQGLPGGH